MRIILAYDIQSDIQRERLAKALLSFGIRTQKSLFEFEVSQSELNQIKRIVKKIVNGGEDRVTIYTFRDVVRKGNTDYLPIDDLVF
ncbi:MAG: CRISPR-associated endonuclease Cas2 [Epsilonproteobacteria bacterium]|nr:CRISPR-associated endonuclease Cas2 [Campylobacterota bacterium]NPA56913.1 CRISPR-associated endonuclease Cas2 [Campylobacterota bacterium]